MEKIILKSFSEIRQSYTDVILFLHENGIEVKNLNEKIAEDHHCWGDDNDDLLYSFIEKYELDHSDFIYNDHFESESEIFNIWSALLTILFIPYWLLVLIINWIFRFDFPFFPSNSINPRKDLTVGDLITWRINKKFILRSEVEMKLYL